MFDIRAGEFKRVLVMQLNVFLLIQCLWIIKPIVTAQFLSRVGIDKLPLVFLLVALTALAVATAYSRILNKMALGSIMYRTYLISILSLLLIGSLLKFHLYLDWMSYVFYIGVALFGLITTSQFWLLGNLVFSAREAKRLFGIIGAGAIAGGISGGYLTSILAPLLDSTNLLFVAATLLAIGMYFNQQIWTTYVPESIRSVKPGQKKSLYEFPLRLIRNSKHLSYLAIIMGISVVVAKLIEFQFSSIASANIKDPDKLTAFFGFWFSTSNVVSLGIQLLITQRILGFLDVGRTLFILPTTLFLGAATVLYTPVLWASTALKLFDISLKQSINKAATELLILPIPLAIKNQTKTFLDVFVDTTATGIGGIVLIFLVNGLNFSVRAVCLMILLLICLWIYFVVRVRKEYLLSFEEKLGIGRHLTSRKEFHATRQSAIGGIRRTLQTGTTKQILYLLARIEEGRDLRLMPDIIPLLSHETPQVRKAALRCLYYHNDHNIINHITPLLKDPDYEVRSRAFSSLLVHTRQNRAEFINEHIHDADPAIRSAALVGLATEARGNTDLQKVFNLEERLQEFINVTENTTNPNHIESNKITIARAIGYGKLSRYYPLLETYMKDSQLPVQQQAILSAGSSQHTPFIRLLLEYLPNKSTRANAQKALARFESNIILPILTEVSSNPNTKIELLLQLPMVAESMDTQQSVDFLFSMVQHKEHAVKMEALEILHKIKANFPSLSIPAKRILPILAEEARLYWDTLSISYLAQQNLKQHDKDPQSQAARSEMVSLLEHKLDGILERIIWIIGLSHPPGIILPLMKDVRSDDLNRRMNTVEFLDNMLEPALKKIVIPVIETAMLDTISDEAIVRLDMEIPTEFNCYETLLKGEDDFLKLALLALMNAEKDDAYIPLVQLASKDDHPRVRTLAQKMLEKQ